MSGYSDEFVLFEMRYYLQAAQLPGNGRLQCLGLYQAYEAEARRRSLL